MLLLGGLVLSFIVYTARAEGDDHIGRAPAPVPQPLSAMPERPDVILITVDTLRADRLGAYGYAAASTPNIDAMGRSGVVYANTTVPLPRTTPALASLLTGLGISDHGSREVWEPVNVEEGQRLAEIFGEAGYVTVGLSANSAAGTRQRLAVGFDQFLDYGDVKKKKKRTDADVMTTVALDLVDGVDSESPLFLWVHYVDPHWKYGPPRKRWEDQPTAKKCRGLQGRIKRKKLSLGNMFVDAQGIATEAFDDCSALYDAEVAFIDSEVGRLVEGLRERGRWEDSLRVFTSDHGENMGEDGLFFAHGPSLADAALRVPLIIAGPTIPAGRFDGGIAIIEDVAPTLLDLAGVDPKLWPEFTGSSLRWRWDDQVDHPIEISAYAKAESGGALHPDTYTYVVSGRQRSKYCYNGERYSMCFDPDKVTSRRAKAAPSASEAGAPSPEDADEDEDEDDEGDEGQQDTSEYGAIANDADFEFFDRSIDPLLREAVEDVPDEVRNELMDAKRRWDPESTRLRAVRDTNYKLVAYPLLEGGYRYALYDLLADPSESSDIKARSPRVFKRMKSALDDWEGDLPVFVSRERSESELEELRALGYVQ